MEENTHRLKYHIVDEKIKKAKNPFTKLMKMLLAYEFVGSIIVGIIVGLCVQNSQKAEIFNQYDGYILAISFMIGLLFVKKFRQKEFKNDLLEEKKKMNKATFMNLFFVLFMGQFLFMAASEVSEFILNCFGLSIANAIDSATMQSDSLSMILYGSFFAPVVEEIVFRGAVCKSLSKYGKTFAIVVSATLFGIMHGNIFQGLFAFYMGLVLGYVSLEYSLKWTILFHFLNNFGFGVLVDGGLSLLGDQLAAIVSFGLLFIIFGIGCMILWKYQKKIKGYIQNNQTEKENYQKMFSNGWMILYILFHVLNAVSMISYMA